MQKVQQGMVVCFDAVRLSMLVLIFEHYNRILHCELVLGRCSVCSFQGATFHNAFVLHVVSTSLRFSVLLCSSVIQSATG